MARLKYSVVAGAVGFLGGVLFKEKYTLKNNKVSAAYEVELPPGTVPVEVDDSRNHVARTMRFNFPSVDSICTRKSYVLSYDRRNRVPNWVLEHLTSSNVLHNESVNRGKNEFFEDNSIHPFFRSTISDYKDSGYDKGHLAAACNHRSSQDLYNETFLMTNVSPQVGKGFNRDAWNKLEKRVVHLVNQYKNVYVCTGPLYLPRYEEDGKKYIKYEVIGSNNVAVPTHFFKVIVGETENDQFDMEAYVMPNTQIEDSVPLGSFLTPKETIERHAGFLIFEKLQPTAFRKINGSRVWMSLKSS